MAAEDKIPWKKTTKSEFCGCFARVFFDIVGKMGMVVVCILFVSPVATQ